jgi:uncharacterized membrane protein YfcA
MPVLIFIIIIISFLATLVRSTFGFGESLIAVPLFALFMPLNLAVPLSVLMSILIAFIVVIQDRQHIQINSAKWLIIFAVTGIPLGLLLLVYGNEYWGKTFLGLLIAGYSLYSVLKKNNQPLEKDNQLWLFICGFLSGVLGGAYGINGPPLVVYGNKRQWSATHFRATLQAYFLPVSLIAVLGYATQGLLDWKVFQYFMFCLPAMIPAIFLGRYLNRSLRGSVFFKYIYWGLMLEGILLVAFTLFEKKY